MVLVFLQSHHGIPSQGVSVVFPQALWDEEADQRPVMLVCLLGASRWMGSVRWGFLGVYIEKFPPKVSHSGNPFGFGCKFSLS